MLGILDPESGDLVDAAGPWTAWQPTLAVHGTRVYGVAASPRSAYEVVELDTATGHARAVGAQRPDPVDPAYYPEPQSRTFLGPDNRQIHAHVYPPHHPACRAAADELPPTWSGRTAAPPTTCRPYSTCTSRTSRRAASAWSR